MPDLLLKYAASLIMSLTNVGLPSSVMQAIFKLADISLKESPKTLVNNHKDQILNSSSENFLDNLSDEENIIMDNYVSLLKKEANILTEFILMSECNSTTNIN